MYEDESQVRPVNGPVNIRKTAAMIELEISLEIPD